MWIKRHTKALAYASLATLGFFFSLFGHNVNSGGRTTVLGDIHAYADAPGNTGGTASGGSISGGADGGGCGGAGGTGAGCTGGADEGGSGGSTGGADGGGE